MRDKPTTSYNKRPSVSSDYTSRLKTWFIMDEALNFLVTEDDDYLVLEKSIVNTYNTRSKPNTIYS